MRNLRCSEVMDDPLRFARSPLYRQTVFPVPGFDFPCGGEEDFLYTGAHAESTPEGG